MEKQPGIQGGRVPGLAPGALRAASVEATQGAMTTDEAEAAVRHGLLPDSPDQSARPVETPPAVRIHEHAAVPETKTHEARVGQVADALWDLIRQAGAVPGGPGKGPLKKN